MENSTKRMILTLTCSLLGLLIVGWAGYTMLSVHVQYIMEKNPLYGLCSKLNSTPDSLWLDKCSRENNGVVTFYDITNATGEYKLEERK